MPLLAFTHIPKTAGTSLHHILRRTFGAGYAVVTKRHFAPGRPFDRDDLRRLRRCYPRLRGFGGHSVKPYGDIVELGDEVQFITLLRDPVQRVASHFAHEVRHGRAGADFFRWLDVKATGDVQTRSIAGEPDGRAAIERLDRHFVAVGLVERFDASTERFRRRLPSLAVPRQSVRRNPTRQRSVRDAVLADDEAVAAIRSLNPQDLVVYAHVRERWDADGEIEGSPEASAPSEWVARGREWTSRAKERVVLGVPRRLARAGVPVGRPL